MSDSDVDMKAHPAIHIVNLSHSFKKQHALHRISFDVLPQSIHGFVGPNGAGKTTTLKILATLLKPQEGVALVYGESVATRWKQVRRLIGYMPDHFSMYRQMTVFEYLDFFAAAYGLSLERRDRVVQDVLALTDRTARKDSLISSLSRGMMQRVSLARVLVNDPQLLLLDEPASGLDPRARIELMEILRELRRMGKTIFISSHILSELADLCDSVTIVDHGRVKYSGSMKQLLAEEGEQVIYLLELAEANERVESALRALPWMRSVEKEDGRTHYLLSCDRAGFDGNQVLRTAIDQGATVVSFQADRRHLNQVFMELTEPGVR